MADTPGRAPVGQARRVSRTPGASRVGVRVTVLRDIVAQARQAAPEECCGLLIGTAERVEPVHAARNLCGSPTRYLIDPADHFAAIRSARQAGLVGAYHSHPVSTPSPSPTDEREATDPGFLHLIVSPVTRGFRLVDGRLEGVELLPVPDV